MKNNNTSKSQVKFPISFKLGTIFSILVVLALGGLTITAYTLVSDSEESKAVENNQTLNARTAMSVESMVLNIQSNTNGYLNSLILLDGDENFDIKADLLFADLCQRNDELLFIYKSSGMFRAEQSFITEQPEAKTDFTNWLANMVSVRNQVMAGSILTENISSLYKFPVLCILYSFYNPISNEKELIACAFDSEKYANMLSTSSFSSSFMVNKKGEVLIHDDIDKVLNCENLSKLEAVKNLQDSKKFLSQNLYPDENGKNYYYATYPIVNGNMYVLTSVSEEDVFETVRHLTYRIVSMSLAILFFAILIIRIFSKSITHPIEELVEASNHIEKAEYDEIELEPKTKDEIGRLTNDFLDMVKGLKERHNLLEFTEKAVNPIIAKKALAGEISIGGVDKKATVFFSDIRNFTAMSEKMTAGEVVDFLNDYMTQMVACVEKTGGIVDKYIGDSVMAVWGAAASSGKVEWDAMNAVLTALSMREALNEINKKRIMEGKAPVRIGCGINTGDVVAGFIGSEAEKQKWEYTVIGDDVNLASRTEALNKPFGTDILITENTYRLIKDWVVVEEMPAVHVKGKEKDIRMFAVLAARNAEGTYGFKDIATLRNFLGTEAPDMTKVNPNEEEKKFEIHSQSK